MSCYLVSHKTIDCVTTELYRYLHNQHNNKYKNHQELYDELLELNFKALAERYGYNDHDANPKNYDLSKYHYQRLGFPNRFEVLKRIECYLYNCAEGDVLNDELYKEVEKLRIDLMSDYIMGLKEYEEAPGWE